MLEEKQFNMIVGGNPISISTGKLAGQAGGAVVVQSADTILLATATMGGKPREGINFLPLIVDYEERLYAGGRIPGSFFRREGRPSEAAILIDRLTDRSIRPLFPKDIRNEIQVIIYSLSSDGQTPIDILAIVAASAALTISDVPFEGPVGAVRVARIDGEFVINPTYQQLEQSELDLRIAGTRDAILMVECSATEVEEQTIVAAIEAGHREIGTVIDLQDEMKGALGKTKREYSSVGIPETTQAEVNSWLGNQIDELLSAPRSKAELSSAYEEIAGAVVEAIVTEEHSEPDVRAVLGEIYKKNVRKMILDRKVRVDGRAPADIREITAEIDLSPRAHGSGLFTRGETQVLTMATLGTPR